MSEIHFLNIDLDIESEDDISILVEEFEKDLTVMTHHHLEGSNHASFETGEGGVENIVRKYIECINELSEASQKLWKRCKKREFNFGFESGYEPNHYITLISESSLSKIVSVGGSIGITIYPISEQST